LFDLDADPQQIHNLCAEGSPASSDLPWTASQELLQWHMRTAERTLSGSLIDSERGLVRSRDTWR
jgi:hypothetical protein